MKIVARFVAVLSVIAFGLGSATAIGAGLVDAGSAGAVTTFVVNDASDAGLAAPGTETTCTSTNVVGETNTCTLRAAIEASENLAASTTITLPDPNTVANNAAAQYDVDSGLGQLDVNDNGNTVTIDGAGEGVAVIQAQCVTACEGVTSRVLKIESGTTADISGVTVEDGDPSGGNGGGILDCGDMTLTNSTVTDNTATISGGGMELSEGGTATLTDDTISDNSQTTSGDQGGGGIGDDSESTNAQTLTLSGTTVTGNMSAGDGAGIEIFGDDTLSNAITIEDSTISDNTVEGAAANGAGVSQDAVSTLTVTGSTITGNATQTTVSEGVIAQYGGGVSLQAIGSDSSFTGDTISDNTSVVGGGVSMSVEEDPTFTDDTVSGNTATYGAGGFYIGVAETDAIDITGSTISGNSATGTAEIDAPYDGTGAGIVADGCHSLDLTNDTISGNIAENNGGGLLAVDCDVEASGEHASAASAGGAFVPHATLTPRITDSDTLAFLFDTVTGNSAGSPTDSAGNIWQADGSTITLASMIVADGIVGTSPTTNCEIDTDAGGSFTSLGYNLIDDTTCGTPGTGDIIGQDPQLGALGDNGGPTQTELPASASPAVGAVPAAVCSASGVSTDQRGVARPAGNNGTCTIGAVEVAQTPTYNPNGYRLVADEGGIFDFGLNFNGSLANNHLNAPIVDIANAPGPNGYLMVGSDGGVFALGGANFYGSLGGQSLPSPIAAIAATPSEDGYWLASQSGTIYHFGNTPSLPAVQLPPGAHIVGMASDNTGKGAWLVDQLGDVYAEGDANYLGGMGGKHINAPVVGISALVNGAGYVLGGSDGGVYDFGVGFYGSVPGSLKPGASLVAPIVGIALTHSGHGYWLVGADGGVFNYGDAPFLGSIYTTVPSGHLNGPIVGIQPLGSAPA